MAKLWDKWGDIQRRDDYDPNSETGRRELIKFEKKLKEFANKGAVKKLRVALLKPARNQNLKGTGLSYGVGLGLNTAERYDCLERRIA